jgi:hypothetical protein
MNSIDSGDLSPSLPSRLCLLVAGMHRSGTSAMTRVINLLGAKISSRLMPPIAGNNDRGFWESSAVMGIHDDLLHALRSSYDDPFLLPDDWMRTDAARRAKSRLLQEIKKEFANSRIFVVKDPRIARLLPLWLELLDELSIEPVILIAVRNPLEIATSLNKRDQFSLEKSWLMYIHSSLEVELASRGRRRFWIRYDRLVADWRAFAADLGKVVGRDLLVPAVDHERQIADFLTDDLHHNRFSREALVSTPGVKATVVEIHDRMIEAADTGEDSSLRQSFDAGRRIVADMTDLFHGLALNERQQARHQEQLLEAAIATQSEKALRLTQELSATERRLTALGETASRLSQQIEQQREENFRLEALCTWNAARSRNSGKRYGRISTLWKSARYRLASRTMQSEMDILERHLGEIGTSILYGRPYSAMRKSALLNITSSSFWHDVVLPLAQQGGLAGLFDAEFYFNRYSDVRDKNVSPLRHYVLTGAAEGRDPHAYFSTRWYLARYPDVASTGNNPLFHFANWGWKEGRSPHPSFDSAKYLDENPDVRNGEINPLMHFLRRRAGKNVAS